MGEYNTCSKCVYWVHGVCQITGERKNDTICNCGKFGCAEQYCSATGIVRLARNYLKDSPLPTELKDTENLTCKDIFDAAKTGDPAATAILEQVYDYLGMLLGNVCSVVNPEVVVIGGGVSKAGEMLLEGVVPYFQKYVFHAASGARLALASLGNAA